MREHGRQLFGQRLLVIGGSSGIGLETARRAHAEGAKVIITGRHPGRVQRAGLDVEGSIAAFDATDFERLGAFFDELPAPIDHVMVTGPRPRPLPLAQCGVDEARRELDAHLVLPLQVAREAAQVVRPGGTALFTGCSDARRATAGRGLTSAITAGLATMTKCLASELAPIRVNLIVTGFADTSASAVMVQRRSPPKHPETLLAIGRRIAPGDVAALAIHLMTNTAITGATFEIDGGQQLVER